MRPFIILTNPRSGSTWFADTLNNIEGLTCHDELLVKTRYRLGRAYLKSAEYQSKVQTHPHWEYFAKRNGINRFNVFALHKYLTQKFSESTYSGFKLMFKQMLRYPSIIFFMLSKKAKIIRLKRENLLNIIISWETMKHRDRGHNYDKVKQVSVELDPKKIIRQLKILRLWDNITDLFCKIMPLPVYYLSYEELKSEPALWRDIVDFITNGDIENFQITSKYKQTNTAKHNDLISNYDEIKKKLNGTKFANLID